MKTKVYALRMFALVAMTSALDVPAVGQAIDTNPLAKFRAENLAKTKVGEIQTNADLDPEYPFTFVLITQNGASGQPVSQAEAMIRTALKNPQTQPMQVWRQMASVREFAATDPFVTEQHPRLLTQHKSLPIVALVDSRGGDWCSLSGDSLPGSEYEIARVLDIHYAAIMEAASRQNGQNIRVMSPNQLAEARGGYIYSPRPNRPSSNNGPSPFRPNNTPFRPRIIPDGGLVQIPDQYEVNANTTMDPDLRTLAYFGMGALLLFGFMMMAAIIIAAAIRAFGQTDPDDDDMIINQPIDDDDDEAGL